MRRTLGLSLIVVGAAVALALASYSALAGAGPVADVAGAVVGANDPDDGNDANAADADDGDSDEVEAQDGDDDSGEGAEQVAQVIADTFDVGEEEVLALHEQGIGFGAIFKLYLLAAAGGPTVEALQSAADGDGEFAFGELFREVADEVSALSVGEDGMPKNLGQLVSAAKNGGKGTAVAVVDGDEDGGHGPPDHAPAHGRN